MSLLVALLVGLALAAAPYGTSTTLTAADGAKVTAVYGAPTKGTDGVVLVHGEGGGKEDWASLGAKLARAGLWVVAVDLRGHDAASIPPEDYPKMAGDVRAGVAYLTGKGVTRLALVGSDLGANLALTVAVDEPKVVSLVLLSPGMDLHGIIANTAMPRLGARPVMLVASDDDVYGSRSVRSLAALAAGEHPVVQYTSAGKGARMLARAPDLESRVLGFVSSHWVATAPPPSSTEITVTPGTLETTAPPPTPPAP